MDESYHRQGYRALPGLFPAELTHRLFEQMRQALVAQHGTLSAFRARGPLLANEAIEVYALQYPPLTGFLWGLTPKIADLVGRPLLPTYAYFRAYQRGNICRVHVDRPACEHSLSLTLVCGDQQPWALAVGARRVATPSAGVADDFGDEPFAEVPMRTGDAVLYQGLHHRHGRVRGNPNQWSAHVFLHWVDAEGLHRDHAFDQVAIARAAAEARG